MSAIEDYAKDSRRELEAATQALLDLKKTKEWLIDESRKMGSEVTQGDIAGIQEKITAKKGVVAELSQEFQRAEAALAADKRLENEMHKELNKDNDPTLGVKPGDKVDNFGKKKDDLEL